MDVENVLRDLPAAQDESPSKKAKTAAGGDAADAADAQPSSTKGRFKIVGRVVMAMKRFQASLNPTYSYGKRSSDGGGVVEQTDGHRVLVQPAGRASGTVSGRTTSGRTASGRTLSGRPTSPGQHHGHKGNLLFRPLPELDTTVKSG